MSVVAWDGKTLAADRQMVNGQDVPSVATKLFALGDCRAAAIVGTLNIGLELVEWAKGGCLADRWPARVPLEGQYATKLLVLHQHFGTLDLYEGSPFAIPVREPLAAWGSGGLLALGAMGAGADAVAAVRVASRFDIFCGMGVDAAQVGKRGICTVDEDGARG